MEYPDKETYSSTAKISYKGIQYVEDKIRNIV